MEGNLEKYKYFLMINVKIQIKKIVLLIKEMQRY